MSRNKSKIPKEKPCRCVRRGRSSELITKRDERLIRRYYELTEVQRMRVDDVLRQLSTEEFFISERRIWDIVNGNLDLLDKIKNGEENL